MNRRCIIVLCLAIRATNVWAQPAEAPSAQAPPQSWHLSPLVIKEVEPIDRYLYAQTQTTFAQIGEAIKRTFFVVVDESRQAGLYSANPAIFIYRGATPDPDKPFTLLAGLPMAEGAKATAHTTLATLDRFRCASVYYTGSITDISKAYDTLMPKLVELGHKPTEEVREVYLWWAGEESRNNVIEIQVGIAAGQ